MTNKKSMPLTDGNPIVEGGFMRPCCICGKQFDGRGNNLKPIETDGVCCDECNNDYVIPRRLRDIAIARIQRDKAAIAIFGASYDYTRKYREFKQSERHKERVGGQQSIFDYIKEGGGNENL